MSSSLNLDSKGKEPTDLLTENSNIPLLPADSISKSSSLSKADEIKRTIAAIAGPSGTLPLFPSSQSITKPSPAPKPNVQKSNVAKNQEEATPSPKISLKPSPFSNSEKESNSNRFEIPKLIPTPKGNSHVNPKNDTQSNVFVTPTLKSTTAPKFSPKKEEDNDEAVLFTNIKLKRIVDDPAPQVTNPQPAIMTDVSKTNKQNSDGTLNKDCFEDEKSSPLANSNSPANKKVAPKALPPKPKSLASKKTISAVKPNETSEEIDIEKFGNLENSRQNIRNRENDFQNHKLSEPIIISPVPKASVSGLRSFQITKEHNTHDQMASSINGNVPMPGMTSSFQSSKQPSASFSSTPSPREQSESRFSSPTRHSTYSGTNFSASVSYIKASPGRIGSPGGFLASRASTTFSISRPSSPTKGGFVQSAMLKRDNTLARQRNNSANDAGSANIFDGIALAAPTDNFSSFKSVYRHSRAGSTTSIDSRHETEGDRQSNGLFHSESSLKPSHFPKNSEKYEMSQSVLGHPFKASTKSNTNESVDNNETSVESSQQPFATPTRSPSRFTENRTSSIIHSPANNLKHTDSRRWSPSRQTWLENALKKTSQQTPGGYDTSHSHHNRIPVPSSPVLSRSVKNDPVIAEKPVFSKPPEVQSKISKSPEPKPFVQDSEKKVFDKAKNTDTQDNNDDNDLKFDTKKPTSSSQNFETNSTKPTIPAKKVSLGRSATSVTRNKSTPPVVPKKPDFGANFSTKPSLPSDALAKSQDLRSSSSSVAVSDQKNTTDGDRSLPQRANSSLILNYDTLKPVSKFSSLDKNTNHELDGQKPIASSRSPAIGQNKTKTFGKEANISDPTSSVSLGSDRLTNKTEIKDFSNDIKDPVMEARRVLFGSNVIQNTKPADKRPSSNSDSSTVLKKKGVSSFASDLSAVLQRGNPFGAMPNAGIRKAHTFDSAESAKMNRQTDDNGEPAKVELTHMTKSRTKGPRGRRLPKTVSNSTQTSNSVSGRQSMHTRQRSRSLSPGQIQRVRASNVYIEKPAPFAHKILPIPAASGDSLDVPKNSVRSRYSFEAESDEETSNTSSFYQPSSNESVVSTPKQRKPLPVPPSASSKPKTSLPLVKNKETDSTISHESIPLSARSGSPSAIKLSSTIANNFQRSQELAEATQLQNKKKENELSTVKSGSNGAESLSNPMGSQTVDGKKLERTLSTKPRPVPPVKPRQLSSQK